MESFEASNQYHCLKFKEKLKNFVCTELLVLSLKNEYLRGKTICKDLNASSVCASNKEALKCVLAFDLIIL